MPHLLSLDRQKVQREEQLLAGGAIAAVDGPLQFVYMLLPHANGYRVLRAPIEKFLEIAEPVGQQVAEVAEKRAGPSLDAFISEAHGVGMSARLGPASSRPVERRQSAVRPIRQQFGDVAIDAAAREVTKGGVPIAMAPMEFKLLLALLRKAGAAASRRELMREVWGVDSQTTPRTVDTHIFNLRRKLEADPSNPEYLLTVSKVGYRLKAQ